MANHSLTDQTLNNNYVGAIINDLLAFVRPEALADSGRAVQGNPTTSRQAGDFGQHFCPIKWKRIAALNY